MSEKASTSSCSERLSDGWIDSEGDDETPVPKKKRLSLSLKKRSKLESDSAHLPCATSEKENAPRSRWSFLNEVEELGKEVRTEEHSDDDEVALAWQTSRNEEFDRDLAKQVPSTLLESSHPSILSKWLSLYCAEARKKDGGSYPPKTVSVCAANRSSPKHAVTKS